MSYHADRSSLSGQTAIVTGGARRVGAALVRALHAAGANVMIHYRNSADAAHSLSMELNRARAHSAALHSADLRDPDTAPALVEHAIHEFGGLDILINNASTFYPTPMGEVTLAQWNDLLGSNLQAPFFLSQAAAASLSARSGLILNMIDIHAQRPLRDYPVYSVAKAGLAMLTRSLARELGPRVRVNGIAPGPVLWPDSELGDSVKREIVSKTALGRHGSPADIARTALFLAQDAPYITGQIIAVDGGRSL